MNSLNRAMFLVVAGGLFVSSCAVAQQSLDAVLAGRPTAAVRAAASDIVAQPEASTETALAAMFAGADVVFAGEVTEVRHEGDSVAVVFRVEDAVRGVAAGDGYTLREWSGLWADQARYAVGDRRLMLLHATSAAGFASPVGGTDGAIPMAGDAAAGTLDLRWVAARVGRGGRGTAVAAARSNGLAEGNSVVATPSAAYATVAAGMDKADRSVVIGMLHAWQRTALTAQ